MIGEGGDRLGWFWRRAAHRFEPIGRAIAAATGWLVLNPGRYGERWHAEFRRLHPPRPRPLLVCGLNPGPYGMAQTGVPFTDLKRLRSHLPRLWSALAAAHEPLQLPGLAPRALRPHLTRTFESSAVRVHLFLQETFGSTEAAVREVVFVNPCPLLFVERASGANRTPADLPRALRAARAGAAAHTAPLMARFDALRRATVIEAVRALAPRGAVLLGRDVAAAVGAELRRELGSARVVEWEHPARAVPRKWSRGLAAELTRRRLLRRR